MHFHYFFFNFLGHFIKLKIKISDNSTKFRNCLQFSGNYLLKTKGFLTLAKRAMVPSLWAICFITVWQPSPWYFPPAIPSIL